MTMLPVPLSDVIAIAVSLRDAASHGRVIRDAAIAHSPKAAPPLTAWHG
jgi:hypothetical protein